MHLRKRHSWLALALWFLHLALVVGHGVAGSHAACAPDGDPVDSVATPRVCPFVDVLGQGLPAADPPDVACAPAHVVVAAPILPAPPDVVADVLAVAPKGSPPVFAV